MSGPLILIVMLIYAAIGVEQLIKGQPWLALTWLCYSGANVGLYMVTVKA